MAHATDKPRISFITIATLPNRVEARPIVALLAAAGIRCLLSDESDASFPSPAGGRRVEVKVQVSRLDVGRALALLNTHGRAVSPPLANSRFSQAVNLRIDLRRGVALALVGLIGAAGVLALLL
jgi:hypothetical protein